jgi:hypothetical protein
MNPKRRHCNALGLPLIEDAAACAWHRLELVPNPEDDSTPAVALDVEVHGDHCHALVCLFGRRVAELRPWAEA